LPAEIEVASFVTGTRRLGWSFSGNPAWAASNAGFTNPAYACCALICRFNHHD
jgi:hypothetical protein